MEEASIRITAETKKKLHKIKGKIEAERGESTSMDEAINELISNYKKRHK